MHFYHVALKIVPSNACVENHQNKNYYRLSSTFSSSPRSSDKLPKFLQLKSTNTNAQNVIYKIKSYFR